jgi:signal peptidase II
MTTSANPLNATPTQPPVSLAYRWLAVLGLGGTVILLDHLTKLIAVHTLRGQPIISLWGGSVRLLYSENTGAFLGLGSTLPENARFWIFTVMVGLLLGGVLLYLLRSRHITHTETLLYALILGGGLSNLLDRIFNNGIVVDFLNVGLAGLRTGIFNLADVAITGAIIVLTIVTFTHPHPSESPAPSESDSPPPETGQQAIYYSSQKDSPED